MAKPSLFLQSHMAKGMHTGVGGIRGQLCNLQQGVQRSDFGTTWPILGLNSSVFFFLPQSLQ